MSEIIMVESLSKTTKKEWFPIFIVIIATAIMSSCTTNKGKSPKGKSELEKSIEEYNALAAELDADLADYRASMPVFIKFFNLSINKIFPLLQESDKAGQWLSKAREQGTLDWETSTYDKKKAEKILMTIMASIYKDVYSEFQKALDSGKLTLTNEQEKIYFQSCIYYIRNITEPISEPLEDHYPYKKGTLEYNIFVRDLGQVLTMAGSPLGKMIYQIPPELEEKQNRVTELYEQLVQQKKQSKMDITLPEKYKEGYLKKLEDEQKKIGKN